MQDDAKKHTMEVAHALERRGEVDAAVHAFLRVGEADEAARVLMAALRFADAGRILVKSLGVPIERLAEAHPDVRRAAQRAAICFSRAGDVDAAVDIFLGLGDRPRAIEVLERAGAARLEAAGQIEAAMRAYLSLKQYADAARLARALGRSIDAGELYVEGGRMYEAARCFLEAGDSGRALASVVRVSRDAPEYPEACAAAIRMATSLRVLDFELDQFLTRFVAGGPRSEKDLETFYLLGKLYETHDFLGNASDVYRKLMAVAPGYRDVVTRAKAIEAETRGSAMVFERIVREDAAFWGEPHSGIVDHGSAEPGELPSLPPLPAEVPPTWQSPNDPHGHSPSLHRGPPPAVHVQSPRPAAVAPAPPRAPSEPPPAPSVREELRLGEIICERYRIERKLGQGGMAAVFQVFDEELGERVALKMFSAQADDAQLIARFKQELSLSRQLNHPNLVRLYDIGTYQGAKFITMELLLGSDLRARMPAGEPMEFQRAVRYLVQMCAGLHAAHERGVVHRDIKPENMFVTSADDNVKVMDFGIAKQQKHQNNLTVAGFLAGTPAYMSPEQISDFGAVTHLSDVYAVGVMAYEMFTGSVPFDHEDMGTLLRMHLTRAPQPPKERNPRLPDELEYILLQMLEKEPRRRLQSCHDFAQELLRLARPSPARARR